MALVRRTPAVASVSPQGPSRADRKFLAQKRAARIQVVYRPAGVIMLRTSDAKFGANVFSAKTPDPELTNAVMREALRPLLRERAASHLNMQRAALALPMENFNPGVAAASNFDDLPAPAVAFQPRPRRAPRRLQMAANAIGEPAPAEDQLGLR